MKRNAALLAIIVTLGWVASGAAYTGDMHKMLTRASVHVSLPRSGYTNLYACLMEQDLVARLVAGSSEPDAVPLSDAEIRRYSVRKDYDFRGMIDRRLDEAVDAACAAVPLPGLIYEPLRTWLKREISDILARPSPNGAGVSVEQKLRAATQHTYVYHPGGSTCPLDAYFGLFTCSPYAAQAEYNLGMAALNGKSFDKASRPEQEEAMRRLGRTLHYIQDMTTPSSTEIGGNFSDLVQGLRTRDLTATYTQDIQEDIHIRETYAFDKVAQSFGRRGETGPYRQIDWVFDPHTCRHKRQGLLPDDPLFFAAIPSDTDVAAIMVSIWRTIRDGNYMEFCDGVPRYTINTEILNGLRGGFVAMLTHSLTYGYVYPMFLSRTYDSPPGPRTTASTISVDDNFLYVSDRTVPIAITACAQIIVMFFEEARE